VDLRSNSFNLNIVVRERSEKILRRFGEVIFSDVSDLRLLAALEDVKKYWGDLNRPSLTSFSCEAVGGNSEVAENAALMFTLASAGFGVHDDIIDRSLNKHLRRTILGLHGADTALLVGDLLIVKGWTVAHEMIRKSHDPKIADVLEAYGRLSVEICEAEFMEVLCRKNLDIDLSYYENILWKEMAETEACCRIGAMLGHGRAVEIKSLSEFGRRIGFISRLTNEVEDCLNLKGDLPHRIQYESLPLPLLYASKFSTGNKRIIEKIILKKRLVPEDASSLLQVCFDAEAFEYMRSLAERNKAEAALKLCSLKNSVSRDILLSLLTTVYARIDGLCI
jgi:geranylgeranyl pyrophosphate synthase